MDVSEAVRNHPAEDVLFSVRMTRFRAFEYTLESPSRRFQFLPRIVQSLPIKEPDEFRRWIFQRLEKLHIGIDAEGNYVTRSEALQDAESLGRLLAERLFPPQLNAAWKALPRDTSLLVNVDEPWIPWEIVKPPEMDFFALHFRMGRWAGGESGSKPSQKLRVERAVIVSAASPDGAESLEDGGLEAKKIEDAMRDAGIKTSGFADVMRGKLEELLAGSQFDLLHVICHGEFGENADESALLLHDRRLYSHQLSKDEIRTNLRACRPMVVFSACEVGRSGASLSGAGGWPNAWIQGCGASAFIGPLWLVNSRRSARFFRSFYRQFLHGKPVGQALLEARRQLFEENSKDLTWLAWSFHGHPNGVLTPSAKQPISDVLVDPERKSGRRQKLEAERDAALPVIITTGSPTSWLENLLPLPKKTLEAGSSPAALLRADYEVVPFHARTGDLQKLWAWFYNEHRVSVWFYSGEGGMGKTRLAREFCKELRAQGFPAGELASQPDLDRVWRSIEEFGGWCLILVDYAETHRKEIATLLHRALESPHGPFRFLLLSRGERDWWELLRSEGHGIGSLLRGKATTVERLRPLALSAEERAASYQTALSRFAGIMERSLPGETQEDFSPSYFDRVLLLHASALAKIESDGAAGEFGILDFLLDREIRFWRRHAEERGLMEHLDVGIRRAMAVITFHRGVDGEAEAEERMRRLRSLRDESSQTLIRIARMLSEIYPGDRWIEPLYPDLLGEHLIQRELERGADELIEIVFGPKDL